MLEMRGDLWKLYESNEFIVIPTNGSVRKDGCCVMGRGLALEAATRIPHLPYALGQNILWAGNRVVVWPCWRLVTFPVKYWWHERANLTLIEKSALFLNSHWRTGTLYLPRVGCGNGRLDWGVVKPILEKCLGDKFVIVSQDS